MIPLRRAAFWAILAVFIAAGIGWMLTVPERPDRVFEAIPAEATFVSVHENLAGEWQSAARNPFALDLLASAGVAAEEVAKAAADPVVASWVRRLASSRTVVAYVPAMGYRQKSAWAAASWIGGQSQRLRWQLQFLKSRDLQVHRFERGQTLWTVQPRKGQSGPSLSLALADGLILACLSEDPFAVRWMLETADRYPWRPSLARNHQPDKASALLGPDAGPHWGWVNVGGASSAAGVARLAAYSADFGGSNELRGRLVAGWPLPGSNTVTDAAPLAPIKRLLGDSADVLVTLPVAWVEPLLFCDDTNAWVEALRDLIGVRSGLDNARVFFALLDRAHDGRLKGPLGESLASLVKGLRVPTLVIGWQTTQPRDGAEDIARAVNRLNAAYGFGLVPHPVSEGGTTLTFIGATNKTVYGKFLPEEQICSVSLGGWTFLASHATVLRQLLKGHNASAAPGSSAWAQAAVNAETAAFAWADVHAANRTVKEAVAAATLALMFEDPNSTAAFRDGLSKVRTGLSALDSVQTFSLRVSPGPLHPVAEFKLVRSVPDEADMK